jgi:hypothetical protein
VTYLQQASGVGTLIFLIAAVGIGTVSAAAMKPRKDEPLDEEKLSMPKTQNDELRAALGTLERLLAAVPGEEFLTDLLAAMLAGRKMLDGALGRTADLIRARVQREAELDRGGNRPFGRQGREHLGDGHELMPFIDPCPERLEGRTDAGSGRWRRQSGAATEQIANWRNRR